MRWRRAGYFSRAVLRAFVSALLAVGIVVVAAPAESAPRPPRSVQQPLLQQILRGFPDTKVSGRVGAPPRGMGVNRHASFARSTWLYFKTRPRESVEYVQQSWQASVAMGLLAGISRSRGWRPVTGKTITIVLPDGRERFSSASVIGFSPGGIQHATEAEAERDLRESAATVGAAVQTIRFPRPLGRLAVELVLATDRPLAFADRSFTNIWAILDSLRGRAEGFYVEVRASDGRWVAALGTSVRTSSTVSTINSDFR
ncbi:MAG TPA: hypothetical protein VGW30_05820 [Gaiellaceae bacterium]|nr:hypothetical protein [Gaiellaceae bacterium]